MKNSKETFVDELKKDLVLFDVPCMCVGRANTQMWVDEFGQLDVFSLMTGTEYYLLHNNRLGYTGFTLITRQNGDELLGVILWHALPVLLDTISKRKEFKGIPIKNIINANCEDAWLLIFNY